MAAKPRPPLQISCATLSESGDVYQAECNVTAAGTDEPESVMLMPLKGKGTRLLETIKPTSPNGIGAWILTIEFTLPKPASLRFKASYPNSATIQVGAVYNPFKKPQAEKPGKGRVVIDERGGAVQEFPSK
jgi:hypothetical protein